MGKKDGKQVWCCMIFSKNKLGLGLVSLSWNKEQVTEVDRMVLTQRRCIPHFSPGHVLVEFHERIVEASEIKH